LLTHKILMKTFDTAYTNMPIMLSTSGEKELDPCHHIRGFSKCTIHIEARYYSPYKAYEKGIPLL